MLERLRILGALAGSGSDVLTLSEVARMSGVAEPVVSRLLEGTPFVNRPRPIVGQDGETIPATYAVPPGERQRLLEELVGVFDVTEGRMRAPGVTAASTGSEAPLGLVAAEDALRLELPASKSKAETWSILDRVASDLELAEAGLPNVALDARESVAARIDAAKASSDVLRLDLALEESLEDFGSEFGIRTLVRWTAHDHSPRLEPALLYLDACKVNGSNRWDLSHIVKVVQGHLHSTPKYVSLGDLSRPSRAIPLRTLGREVDHTPSGHGVFVFVHIDSAVDVGFAATNLGRELERLHTLVNSKCVVFDTNFDAEIRNMVLHHDGDYHGSAGMLDELAFSKIAKTTLDLVRPRAPQARKTRAEAC